jgi:transcriptional regulator with XRE-family HTH domain
MTDQLGMLGRAIACVRLERGLKRRELVALAGISYPFLAEVENGTKLPSLEKLAALAAALGTTPSALLVRSEQIELRLELGRDFIWESA